MAAVPLPGGGAGDLLLLPDPVDGVLNHAPLQADPPHAAAVDQPAGKQPRHQASSLEDLCVMAYLKYLENEIVTYISLTQSKSHLVKGVAKRMIQVPTTHSPSTVSYNAVCLDSQG